MQGVEVQRMANPFANRATKQTPHLPQPGDAASNDRAASGTGDFGPLRRCSSLQGTYLAADSAPGIDLEIDPSQTP